MKVIALLLLFTSYAFSFKLKSHLFHANSLSLIRNSNSKLYGIWGNYKSDGKKEGYVLLALAVAAVVKGQFTSIDLRTTYACPTGINAERDLARYKAIEPDYKCLPASELYTKMLTAPLVFPGDEKWDPQYVCYLSHILSPCIAIVVW